MPDVKAGRRMGGVVVLVGAILLAGSISVPWYVDNRSAQGETFIVYAYPGFPSEAGTIQYSCSGLPPDEGCPGASSYSGADLNNTGEVAETVLFLLVGGLALGVVAGVVGVTSGQRLGRAAVAPRLAIASLIFAAAAPVLYALQLPGAFGKDFPRETTAGPWSSFFGSTSAASWGPSLGWYLSIVSLVILLVGAILLLRFRRNPPGPAPVAAVVATEAHDRSAAPSLSTP